MAKSNVTQLPTTTEFQFGDLTLQLRMDAKSILTIEKRLDESIMGLFIKKQGEFKLPPTNSLLIILQGANKKSGVTDKMLISAFEKYLDSGKTTMDLFEQIQEFLAETGFFGSTEKEMETEKDEVSLDQDTTGEEDSLL